MLFRSDVNKSESGYAEFVTGHGGCALQQEDGLCLLQAEKGPQALPAVCRTFPRIQTYSASGYLEYSLTLACEGVLALLWDLPEGVTFRAAPITDKQKVKAFSFPCTAPWNPHFQQIRSWCIDMLQNRQYPLPGRIMRMGLALQKLGECGADISNWLNTACAAAWSMEEDFMTDAERVQLLPLFLSNNIRLLLIARNTANHDFIQLQEEILNVFNAVIQTDGSIDITGSNEPWLSARERYEKTFGGKDYFMENIMTALFFHLHMPEPGSDKDMWKSFVSFCNLYSFYRFMAVMSCRDGGPADRDGLFEAIVLASRILLHNNTRRTSLQDEFFRNQSTSLAHMAVLLSN